MGHVSRIVAPGVVAVAVLGAGCAHERHAVAPPSAGEGAEAVGRDMPGLHNVRRVTDRLLSGAVPEGDAGFDSLSGLGIRTVISVDGAAPDVERARARGMRYVHIPTTYATVTEGQRLEIARAVRDLPGPVYLHCHHGKHRGPAAAAAAAVALGEITGAEGVAFMKEAGTAANYAGLYACVGAATPASAEMIDGAPDDFPELRKPRGIVAAMVEVDGAYSNLEEIRDAGWRTPKDHPDLVPAAEAGRLVDQLRFSHEDPRTLVEGEGFARMMADAIARASALEASLANGGADPAALSTRLKSVQSSCKECHAVYRDGR